MRLIAIDEIKIGKGADSLKSFWKRLRCATQGRPKIKAVAKHLPDATHVFDHFHVVKRYNDKLANPRRDVQRTAKKIDQKQLLKGTLRLLFKNPENFDDRRNERKSLDEAPRINQP